MREPIAIRPFPKSDGLLRSMPGCSRQRPSCTVGI